MLTDQYIVEVVLKREKINDFSEFPFNLDAFRDLDRLPLHPNVTFIVGENGSGKSTLLEAIAVANGFNPEGGSRNFGFSTRHSHSALDNYIRCSRGVKKPKDGYFLRAESFYNVATEIEALDREFSFGPPIINSYGGTSLHEQSHGESFMALFMNRFSGDSLYILDEPEAALSPFRQMSMISRLHELVLQNSQFIIATHSPIIMAYPEADIVVLNQEGMVKTEYEETDHYQVMKSFMGNRKRMLKQLLGSMD